MLTKVFSSSRETLLWELDGEVVLSVPFGYEHPQYRFLYFHPQTCVASVPEVESGCSEDHQQQELFRKTVRASADDTAESSACRLQSLWKKPQG